MRDGDVPVSTEALTITRYREGSIVELDTTNPHIVLVEPHGAPLSHLEHFPLLAPLHREYAAQLTRIAEIDRDVGAVELSHVIARRISEHRPVTVDLLTHQLPRVLADTERHDFRVAVGQFMDGARFDAELLHLHHLHHAIVRETVVRSRRAMLFTLGVHTMSDATPVDRQPLTADNLRDGAYARQWLTAHREGKLRDLNLIFDKDDGHLMKGVLPSFRQALDAHGIQFGENTDYSWHERLTSDRIVQGGGHALIFDVPKSQLTAHGPMEAVQRLHDLTLDPTKIEYVGGILALAAAEAHDQIRGVYDYSI